MKRTTAATAPCCSLPVEDKIMSFSTSYPRYLPPISHNATNITHICICARVQHYRTPTPEEKRVCCWPSETRRYRPFGCSSITALCCTSRRNSSIPLKSRVLQRLYGTTELSSRWIYGYVYFNASLLFSSTTFSRTIPS